MDIDEIITGVIVAVISAFVISVSKFIYKLLKRTYNNFYGLSVISVELICLIIASVNIDTDTLINNFFSKGNILNLISLLTIVIAVISIFLAYIKHPYKKDNADE